MNLADAHEILSEVLLKGAFVNLAFAGYEEKEDKGWTRKVVYGTLEHYYELDAALESLSPKKPKPSVRVLLLLSSYVLRYLDAPAYAVVNEAVELAKRRFPALAGYVNAVLKKVARGEFRLPIEGARGEEVKYNLPFWLIERIRAEYPEEWEAILLAPAEEREHVRLRVGENKEAFQTAYPEAEGSATGFYVRMDEGISERARKGELTVQGYPSTLAVRAFGKLVGKSFLDVCAAPGGKSVYAAELGATVTACDLHPHRVDLIRAYAKRMKVKVTAVKKNGAKFDPQWENAFDCVLVDAPCSGSGVIGKRRDGVLNRSEESLKELHELQVSLLKNAARYVKPGGILVYSTCSILKEENERSAATLASCGFRPDPIPFGKGAAELTFLPHRDREGFYIARFRKEGEE